MYRAGRCPGGRDGAIFRCGDALHERRSFFWFARGWKCVERLVGRFGCGEIGFELIKLGLPASSRIPIPAVRCFGCLVVRNRVGSVAGIGSEVNVRFGGCNWNW